VKAASCVGWLLLACGPAAAKEDIEFVAEHLPEVAMDNRYATLPLWNEVRENDGWRLAAQAGFGHTSAGNLQIGGPMFAVAASRALSQRWSLNVMAFADTLSLSGGEQRQLQTLFAPSTPIVRPVDARFDGLDGTMRHYGAGLAAAMTADSGWLGEHRWVGGVLFEQVELRDYRWNFEILAGDSAGTRGQIDFDNDYRHVTPFAGLQLVRERGDWTFSPHALFALPLPRRGFVGHIQTAQFDIHGDTADNGNGKHFGDPSLTLGLDITYRPAHLSLDIGTALTQEVLEPYVHRGVDSDWVLSVRWQH
jgi:hypothetical protein